METTRTLMLIAMVLGGVGCAGRIENATAPISTEQPMLRVFGGGSGQVLDFDSGIAGYERAWDTGVLPSSATHGLLSSDSGWTERRDGCFHIRSRTQSFADGATLYRELTEDGAGRLVRVRFFDTRSDGERQGFRVDGRLPKAVVFSSAGETLAASR